MTLLARCARARKLSRVQVSHEGSEVGTLHVLSMYQNEVCRRAKPLLPLLEPLTYRVCVVVTGFILLLEPGQGNEFSWALYIIGIIVRSFSFRVSLPTSYLHAREWRRS